MFQKIKKHWESILWLVLIGFILFCCHECQAQSKNKPRWSEERGNINLEFGVSWQGAGLMFALAPEILPIPANSGLANGFRIGGGALMVMGTIYAMAGGNEVYRAKKHKRHLSVIAGDGIGIRYVFR